MSDMNGVLMAAYDAANNWLQTTTVAGTSTQDPYGHDENGAWAGAFDAATNTIRVILVP